MPRSTPRPYHHGDLAEALVREATEQVRVGGTEGVSLRGVAQAVGVSPSAAYHHFPDKTALLVAVGERAMAELDDRMSAAFGAVPGSDADAAVERFRALGRAYVQFAADEPHLFRHAFGPYCVGLKEQAQELAVPGGDGAPAGAEASGAYQLLNRALDDLEAHGLLRPGTREGLDLVTWTMVHGFASLLIDGFVAESDGEELVEVFARLAVQPSPTARTRNRRTR